MFSDLIFIASSFSLVFFVGVPFSNLVPRHLFKYPFLLAPLFGYGFAGFIMTVGYPLHLSHRGLYVALWLLAGCVIAREFWIRRRSREDWASTFQPLRQPAFIWMAALVVIFLPYWTGGPTFYVFQGWIHDQFTYLAAGLAFGRESFADILKAGSSFHGQPAAAIPATTQLFNRPTVIHLFGVLTQSTRSEQYRMGYLFMAFLGSCGALSIAFLVVNVFQCSLRRAMLVASAIYVGFWGQVHIDFDAWAMAANVPMMVAVLTYVVVLASAVSQEASIPKAGLLPLLFLYGFGFYLYPENTTFHLPALLFLLAWVVCWRFNWRRCNWRIFLSATADSFAVSAALLLGVALGFFYYQGTIGLLVGLSKLMKAGGLTYPVYGTYLLPFFGQAGWFSPFFFRAVKHSLDIAQKENTKIILQFLVSEFFERGRLDLLYYMIADGFYGFFGMYFLTPLASVSFALQQLWRIVLGTFAIGLVWKGVRTVPALQTRPRLLYLSVTVLGCMLITMLAAGNIFGFARGLYYVGPYGMVVLVAPVLVADRFFSFRNLLFLLVIASQISFGLARIAFASYRHPHYANPPYTLAETHYFTAGKTDYDWDVGRFDAQIASCHRVYIDIPFGWQEFYIDYYLYSKEKNYVKKAEIRTSFWGNVIEQQQLDGTEDCTIGVAQVKREGAADFNELFFRHEGPSPFTGDRPAGSAH